MNLRGPILTFRSFLIFDLPDLETGDLLDLSLEQFPMDTPSAPANLDSQTLSQANAAEVAAAAIK